MTSKIISGTETVRPLIHTKTAVIKK